MALQVTDEDIMVFFLAQEALRRNSRNMEFGKLTLDDVRTQALEFIGGDPAKSSGSFPLSRSDLLNTLEASVNDALLRVRSNPVTSTV